MKPLSFLDVSFRVRVAMVTLAFLSSIVNVFYLCMSVHSDFVEATRNTFQENLEELGLGAGPFMFSYHEAASLMDTSAFHSPVSGPHSFSHASTHSQIKQKK